MNDPANLTGYKFQAAFLLALGSLFGFCLAWFVPGPLAIDGPENILRPLRNWLAGTPPDLADWRPVLPVAFARLSTEIFTDWNTGSPDPFQLVRWVSLGWAAIWSLGLAGLLLLWKRVSKPWEKPTGGELALLLVSAPLAFAGTRLLVESLAGVALIWHLVFFYGMFGRPGLTRGPRANVGTVSMGGFFLTGGLALLSRPQVFPLVGLTSGCLLWWSFLPKPQIGHSTGREIYGRAGKTLVGLGGALAVLVPLHFLTEGLFERPPFVVYANYLGIHGETSSDTGLQDIVGFFRQLFGFLAFLFLFPWPGFLALALLKQGRGKKNRAGTVTKIWRFFKGSVQKSQGAESPLKRFPDRPLLLLGVFIAVFVLGQSLFRNGQERYLIPVLPVWLVWSILVARRVHNKKPGPVKKKTSRLVRREDAATLLWLLIQGILTLYLIKHSPQDNTLGPLQYLSRVIKETNKPALVFWPRNLYYHRAFLPDRLSLAFYQPEAWPVAGVFSPGTPINAGKNNIFPNWSPVPPAINQEKQNIYWLAPLSAGPPPGTATGQCRARGSFGDDLINQLLVKLNPEHNGRRRATQLWHCVR